MNLVLLRLQRLILPPGLVAGEDEALEAEEDEVPLGTAMAMGMPSVGGLVLGVCDQYGLFGERELQYGLGVFVLRRFILREMFGTYFQREGTTRHQRDWRIFGVNSCQTFPAV